MTPCAAVVGIRNFELENFEQLGRITSASSPGKSTALELFPSMGTVLLEMSQHKVSLSTPISARELVSYVGTREITLPVLVGRQLNAMWIERLTRVGLIRITPSYRRAINVIGLVSGVLATLGANAQERVFSLLLLTLCTMPVIPVLSRGPPLHDSVTEIRPDKCLYICRLWVDELVDVTVDTVGVAIVSIVMNITVPTVKVDWCSLTPLDV